MGDEHIRLVVTMTTIPSRVKYLEGTIKSLHEQTLLPHQIYLFLPRISTKEHRPYPSLPPGFLHDYPLVKVVETENDYGPITKLYPVLQVEQPIDGVVTVVVTVDDDHFYDPRTLQILVQHWIKEGKSLKKVICMDGHLIGHHWYYSWTQYKRLNDNDRKQVKQVDWPLGSFGVLYPLPALRRVGKEFIQWKKYDLEEAKFVDDQWIGAMLTKRGVKIVPRDLKDQELPWNTVPNEDAANTMALSYSNYDNSTSDNKQKNFVSVAKGHIQNGMLNRRVAMKIQKTFPTVFRCKLPNHASSIGYHYWNVVKVGWKQNIVQLLLALVLLLCLMNTFLFHLSWWKVLFLFLLLVIIAVLFFVL